MLKKIVLKQYQDVVNLAHPKIADLALPIEGWLRTVRKALNLSGAHLSRRVGVTRAWIAKAEKSELTGSVTIKTMHNLANAMNCRFVYAIVPAAENSIEELIYIQAKKKAINIVEIANKQMGLESQSLSSKNIQFEIERLTKQLTVIR